MAKKPNKSSGAAVIERDKWDIDAPVNNVTQFHAKWDSNVLPFLGVADHRTFNKKLGQWRSTGLIKREDLIGSENYMKMYDVLYGNRGVTRGDDWNRTPEMKERVSEFNKAITKDWHHFRELQKEESHIMDGVKCQIEKRGRKRLVRDKNTHQLIRVVQSIRLSHAPSPSMAVADAMEQVEQSKRALEIAKELEKKAKSRRRSR